MTEKAVDKPLDSDLRTQKFREAAGGFLTGVAVIGTNDKENALRGMTVSSFNVVSNNPTLISVCITGAAPSAGLYRETDHIGISVLSEAQESLARRFSSPISNKFEGLLLRSDTRSPILSDCVAWFDCEIRNRVEAGDHVILIAEVLAFDASPQAPLGYCQGNFFRVGPEMATVLDRQRRTMAGWIVEDGGSIILARDPHRDGAWDLPVSVIPRASNTTRALARSAHAAFGADVNISFLYSVIDIPVEHATCFIYRGQLTGLLPENSKLRRFPVDELPWDDIASSDARVVLRRYVEERGEDLFGIYLHIGEGKIARMEKEKRWSPSTSAR